MSLGLLLNMAVAGDEDRTAVVCGELRYTTRELNAIADGARVSLNPPRRAA